MGNHVVSIVGPTATGKTSFATWFTHRYGIYYHLDIAELRKQLGVLDEKKTAKQRLANEDRVWEHVHQVILTHHFILLESTGLSSRLQYVYDIASSTFIVKLIDSKENLEARIIKRNNPGADLELMCLAQDLQDIDNLYADIVCVNLQEKDYPKLAEQIFLSLVEKYKPIEELT